MTTWLSKHFCLEELLATQHRWIDNTPSPAIIAELTRTALRMEAVREILGGFSLKVSSGYRSPALNVAVGGAKTSAHLQGYAVDFNVWGWSSPLAICHELANSKLEFDQLIEEGTWTHISFDPRMRREILTKGSVGYVAGLRPLPATERRS